jgi:hypothetical protein
VLDTIMALWNQRQKESRQKAWKLGLVFLLLCISMSLLLVVLSGRSSERSAMHKKETHQQVIVQPDVTARNFPTPSPTVKVAERIGPSLTHLATVVATTVATVPASVPSPSIVYPVITGARWSAPYAERAPVKTEKKHSARPFSVKRQQRGPRIHKPTRVKVVPIATVAPPPISTVTITSTVTATPSPTATPVATATASATPTASVQDPAVPVIQPFMPGFMQKVIPKERNNL